MPDKCCIGNCINVEDCCPVIVAGGDPYEGDYEITPKIEHQTLPTKFKSCNDDIVVHGIPYREEINPDTGAVTVFIA